MKDNKTYNVFAAVCGRPNVGKSSFINRAVGQKVSIVSDKPQTTRTRIMGIADRDNTQIVFIDTPGFHKPRNLLGENMIKDVNAGFADANAAVLIVEADPHFNTEDDALPKAEHELLKIIASKKIPCILGINKIDLLEDKSKLLSVISKYSKAYDFAAVVPFSARTGDGAEDLVGELLRFSEEGPHYFDEDAFTDQPEGRLVCEMIREKLLRSLDKEIPHGIAVSLERFFERDNAAGEPVIEADAVIFCEKQSHKGIIIGKGGSMLKKVGIEARKDIERFFGCKVNLKLWVKVKEDWRNRENIIRELGFEADGK